MPLYQVMTASGLKKDSVSNAVTHHQPADENTKSLVDFHTASSPHYFGHFYSTQLLPIVIYLHTNSKKSGLYANNYLKKIAQLLSDTITDILMHKYPIAEIERHLLLEFWRLNTNESIGLKSIAPIRTIAEDEVAFKVSAYCVVKLDETNYKLITLSTDNHPMFVCDEVSITFVPSYNKTPFTFPVNIAEHGNYNIVHENTVINCINIISK